VKEKTMTKQGMGKAPQAVFDFTKVGRDFTRQWTELVARATATGKIMTTLMPNGNSRDELEEFEDLHAEYHMKLAAIGDEQAVLVARILKSVPKSWLIVDAPLELDWSQVESLDYIQADRYAQILQTVGQGKHYLASAEAKN
jgi:hypothetical protein